MDQVHSTTTEHKKGQHLTFAERVLIQTRLKDGWKAWRIAAEIGCATNTVRNEIKRGDIALYTGNIHRYKATAGQAEYERNRLNCCRHYDYLAKADFFAYVLKHFTEDNWSLDVCVGRALLDGGFTRDQVVCTKTLYNYINLGLLDIKNIDLPEKLRRSRRKPVIRKNKRILGRSIEERPAEVLDRKEFGHWECDLVIGSKSGGDDAVLTMIERMTREFWMIRIPGKDPGSVMNAFTKLRSIFSEHWNDIFKTITTDNGSEFSGLSGLEDISKTLVYFAHPYTSCEKGSVERHNGIIRRFMPKGKRIDSFTDEQVSQIELWCNSLPRKILGYQTPDELFEAELDRIYATVAQATAGTLGTDSQSIKATSYEAPSAALTAYSPCADKQSRGCGASSQTVTFMLYGLFGYQGATCYCNLCKIFLLEKIKSLKKMCLRNETNFFLLYFGL